MAILKTIFFTVFALGVGWAQAYSPKDGNVQISLGHFWFKSNFEKAGGLPSPPQQGGLGIVAVGDVSDSGAIEIAIFQMSKRYYREQLGYYIGEKTEIVHITMGYRWWLSPSFSAALALFSSYSMGTPNTFLNQAPSELMIKTSAQDITEYGFDGALQGEIWTQGRYSVFVEGRYSWSATAKVREYADHYGAFVGLRYFLQSREKIKEVP